MAYSSSKLAAAVLLYLALILSPVIASMADQSNQLGIGILPTPAAAPAAIECSGAYGVQVGDTCISILNAKKLTSDFFFSINPNLNCSDMFVAQWLCISPKV